MAEEFSKYERARIIGARGLQISMDAPLLLKMEDEAMSDLNFDPLKLAEKELDSGVLPISVKRPMPQKKTEKIENLKIPETLKDEKKEKLEEKEEKDIIENGEIMELVTDADADDIIEMNNSDEESE